MEVTAATMRSRIEGDREREIYRAALDVLAEHGYDKMTLDTVATRARASKATLYRRWASKADLVADAMTSMDLGHLEQPDTGSLRGDLVAMAQESHGGLLDPAHAGLLCALSTALNRDPKLSRALRRRFIDPRRDCMIRVLERARDRGDISRDVDLELLGSIVPAMLTFQLTFGRLSEQPADLISKIIDQILLPAAHYRAD